METIYKQWKDIKNLHNEHVIMVSDNEMKNYFVFDEDAELLSTLPIEKNIGEFNGKTFVSVEEKDLSDTLRNILKVGHRAAICEPQPQEKPKKTITELINVK